MKHKTSGIPIKSSGMSQLLSYESEHTCANVYVWCGSRKLPLPSLNPQQSPTPPVCHPSPILPLQNYQKKSNWSYIRLLYLQKIDNNINFIIYLLQVEKIKNFGYSL